MSEDAYHKLAARLDAIPNGFPSTDSGVELRLLATIYTPEEAALTSELKLLCEPPADIAARVGMDADDLRETLKAMGRRGLLRVEKRDGQLVFGLLPFVVGIYEEQLPRMDEEMAALFEEYVQETQGGMLRDTPSVHRVVPVEESIPFELEIFPYERATEMLEGAKAWGVRDCICRKQQNLIGKGCDHPVENCLVFANKEGAFDHSEASRPISLEEALEILQEARLAGLVHSTGNYQDGHFYICNCCTCSCGILRGVSEFNIPTAIAHSDFRSTVDGDLCVACKDCVEWCQFGALSVPDDADVVVVDYARCVGCGQCVTVCLEGALSMERRPEGEVGAPLPSIREWMVQRAQDRDISIFDVL